MMFTFDFGLEIELQTLIYQAYLTTIKPLTLSWNMVIFNISSATYI